MLPPEASHFPLAEMATEVTRLVWPMNVCTVFWTATSHNRIVPSQLPVARDLPSGEKATPFTSALCPDRSATLCRAGTFHSSTLPFTLPTASVWQSGEKANDKRLPVCMPSNAFQEETAQRLISPSLLPATSHLPSGENATE